jgi:hypothetical protein
MNLQLFGNGGDREQELRNAMLESLTKTTNQLASTLYTHTWKTRTTPDGNQIISLRASQGKREAGFSPWEKTPQASDGDGGVMEVREGSAGKYKLRDFAALSSWPTPVAEPANGTPEAFLERKRRSVAKTGRSMGIVLSDLGMVSQLSSWPTPQANNAERGGSEQRATNPARSNDLHDFALMAAWPTPRTSDTVNTNETPEQWAEREAEMKAKNPSLGGLHKPLGIVSKLASWPTPMAGTPAQKGYNEAGNTDSSRKMVELASWQTPKAKTGKYQYANGDHDKPVLNLEGQADLAAWPTPNAMEGGQTSRSGERKDEMLMGGMVQPSPEGPARLTASGVMLTGSDAETIVGGQLNPALPRWLQALPAAWCQAAIAAHRKLKSAKKKPTHRAKREWCASGVTEIQS